MSLNILLKKIQNAGIFVISVLLSRLLSLKKVNANPKSLLIIRLDAIGDYVLFRNFIEVIKKSDKFSGYKITLCGNTAWKNLAESFDEEFVDEFIWLDKFKFYNNIVYKYRILKRIRNSGFEIVIDPTYTREILFGDLIVKVSNATQRIGCSGSLDKHAKWKRNLLSDNYYTTLFSSSNDNLFEFYRNKEFFENLLGSKLEIKKPYFNTVNISLNKIIDTPYIIIVPGAKDKERIWNTEYFASVAKFIVDKFKIKIIISGSENEYELAELLIAKLNSSSAYNLTGQIPLTSLVKYLEDAELLISNETSPVHIAAAVNTPVICISNGNHLGRFNPYPREIFQDAHYIYPGAVESIINAGHLDKNSFRFKSKLDINEITPDSVKTLINKILNANA